MQNCELKLYHQVKNKYNFIANLAIVCPRFELVKFCYYVHSRDSLSPVLTWSGNSVDVTIERTDPGEPLLLNNNRRDLIFENSIIKAKNDERRIFMNIEIKSEIVVAINTKPITKLTLEEILGKVIQSISNLWSEETIQKYLLYQYQDIFSSYEIDLGRTVIFQHRINKCIHQPIRQLPRFPNEVLKLKILQKRQKVIQHREWFSGCQAFVQLPFIFSTFR